MSQHNNHPLVSIVIATYNGERFLEKQLNSILQQTYPNIEVVVVDDCSTDGTQALLRGYEARYPQVHVYVNEQNLGYVKNFEKGMLLAKGNYIAPSDQDDIWLPEKISVLMEAIGEYDIVYCNSALMDDADQLVGRQLSDVKQLFDFNDPIMYAIGNSAPGHAMILQRKTVLESVPLPEMIPHDHWLSFVATFHKGLHFVDRPLVHYRQHDANVFGAAKLKSATEGADLRPVVRKKKAGKKERYTKIRERVQLMYLKCPEEMPDQKQFFKAMQQCYQSFSLLNNCRRVSLFFRHRHKILSFKRRPEWRRWLFCIKMFWTLQ
ncbi:MAG: glycosyltransferase family 2 protein [Sediminibacterium sp.]|nr:glycosyltransferase family 2 protein [Sediminibacterium sp.]